MITKIQADRQKAESLRKMARMTLERLDKTPKEEYPGNTLVDYYDAIHKLMEAITLSEGIKIRGEGAHQELIDYVAKTKRLDEHTRQFVQQLRDYRNRISYEGFTINNNFIAQSEKKIKEVIESLFGLLKESLEGK